MKKAAWIGAALMICALPGISQARDTGHYLPFQQAVDEGLASGVLDGSVKFYLGRNPGGQIVRSGVTTSKKTNAFNKSDEAACSWAMQSALVAMQNAAKSAGANAVVNIVSNYKHVEYKDGTNYECHAGNVMAGVAIKADLAKVK